MNIANALRDAIVRRVALAVDRLIREGTGGTVAGLTNTTGIQVRVYGTLEVDDLHDAIGAAMAVNAR